MEFYVFVLVLWIPACVVIFKDVLWNLFIWENKEYRLDRFWLFIRWDFEPSNKKINLIVIKVIGFFLTSTFLTTPYIAILGMFIVYVSWVFENFHFLEEIAQEKFKEITFSKIRNIITLVLVFVFLVVLISLISYPFSIINRGRSTDLVAFAVNFYNGNTPTYTDVYLFASFTILTGTFIDLASPLLTAFFVILTSPISFVINLFNYSRVKDYLKKYKNETLVIVIMGGNERVYIKKTINDFITKKYRTTEFDTTFTSIHHLCRNLILHLKHLPQIVILDFEGFNRSDYRKLGELLNPDMVILSDINYSNIGLFKNLNEYVSAREELIKRIQSDGVLIYNSDNKYSFETSHSFVGEKLGYSKFNKKLNSLKGSKSISVFSKLNKQKDLKIEITPYNLELIIPKKKNIKLDSNVLVPVVVALNQLGFTKSTIQQNLSNPERFKLISTYVGDEEAIIIYNNDLESNSKRIIEEIEYANLIKKEGYFNKIVLISDGITELGKYNRNVYLKLARVFKQNINTLITTNNLLHSFVNKNNTTITNIKASDETDLIYNSRKVLSSKQIVILEGKHSLQILETLRKQD